MMPRICGVIDRRLLINYRVLPEVLTAELPAAFRPQIVEGYGMAGICLIRLAGLRPKFAPRWLGCGSENMAHRIAVEWDTADGLQHGVYVMRRDTDSRLNTMLGGRVFPGVHHRACFKVMESESRFKIDVSSCDQAVNARVDATVAQEWTKRSVFRSIEAASSFFECGSIGYSDGPVGGFQGLKLKCADWSVEPLHVNDAFSSEFNRMANAASGAIEFDNALLMRSISHEWECLPDFSCTPEPAEAVRGCP